VDIGRHIHTSAFGKPEKPGRYVVPYDEHKSEILDVSFNDEWAQKLEKKIEQLIPLMLTEQSSKPQSWLILLGDLCYILNVLKWK
jgi:hypothetical protein